MQALLLKLAGFGGALGALARLAGAIAALRPCLLAFEGALAATPDPRLATQADALRAGLLATEAAASEVRRVLKF